MAQSANPGKKITIMLNGITYARYPIKTHLVSKTDNLFSVLDTYVTKELQKKDILVVSERIVAIMEGRSYLLSEITPGFWAKFLYRFVITHPGGIGLKNPHTMQLALQEAGLLRILLASFIAVVTKPFGVKGYFYTIAGHNINAIDGPCDYTLPPGNKSAKLGPKDPQKTAEEVARHFDCKAVIIDANDYGVRVMGYSHGIDPKFIEKIFADNPLGQTNEQTPLAIIRALA